MKKSVKTTASKRAASKTAAVKEALPEQKGKSSRRTKPRNFPIIGMGGSAGSFQAFEKFFTHMPLDSGMAFVIVMHLNPGHKGNVSDLFQSFTPMKVCEAEDGMKLEPNRVYVIPSNKDMGIHNGKLLLLKPTIPRGFRMPIDYFLQSLAEDQWNRAVAIIFSGMGSDGETGLKIVKQNLGMAMVQDPDTAEYSSMPRSAISTNHVDYVLAPEEMPVKLIQYLRHPALHEDLNEQTVNETKVSNAIQKILMLVRSHTGHDFSLYKRNTITRRIDRRIAFHQLPDYSHYVNHLRENPHEISVLENELLIGVTRFFRDSQAFDALAERLDAILAAKPPDETVRVWVAGCSTGEEAYSVAILLMEYAEKLSLKKPLKMQLFATDLDSEAIETARQGIYHGNIVAYISPERIARYFVKKDEYFMVKKELREMIVFAQHNIIKDSPFTKLDLLCCRNVMIYLTTELQKKIIPIFHYSLNDKGLLFLGPAETIGGFTDMFTVVDAKWKIFERREGSSITTKMIDFPLGITRQTMSMPRIHTVVKGRKNTLEETFNRLLLENYTPASIIINEKGDILFLNGKTGRYLEFSSGEAVMNVHRMACEELKYALSNAIHLARKNKTTINVNDIKLKEEDRIRLLNLRVTYLEDPPLQGLVLVVFEDKGPQEKARGRAKKASTMKDGLLEELEKELMYTKQQLHSTIEQMETSVEELKSTNEELQSTNEELQSTNEESLTTKEEMQSLNEELMTINMQYQTKAEELTQLNNDMKNLLDSTEIGALFLDNNLVILRFTPHIKKLFKIIPSDVGRSITHIVPNFQHIALEDTIKEVIEKLTGKEIEVQTTDHEWYNIRIIPYRTLDNFISGAVLTFSKITMQKELQKKLSLSLGSSQKMLEAMKEPLAIVNSQLRIVSLSKSFEETFGVKEREAKGELLDEVVKGPFGSPKLKKLISDVIAGGSVVNAQPVDDSWSMSVLPVKDGEEKAERAVIVMYNGK